MKNNLIIVCLLSSLSLHVCGHNGQVELKATAGSAANLRLLTGEYLQLAIAQADLVQDAYDQTGIFADEEESRGFGAVAALYTETCQHRSRHAAYSRL